MKYCTKCSTSKPVSEFGINRSRKDGLQAQCKSCRKITNHQHYLDNPKREERRAGADRMRARNKALIYEYLSTHPCVDCGLSDWRVLEFDHIGDDKSYDISAMVSRFSVEKIITEIAKCEVRCKNCHTIKTYERAGSWRFTYTPL